jgi:hypothetical protein
LLRFFTNRELSDKLLIPLAKWKRWAREFLPPDPLGGLQSGVARRYSVDQSLIVFVGGHLVSELKTTIPEARQIVADLHTCFNEIGAFVNTRIHPEYQLGHHGSISTYSILYCRQKNVSKNEMLFAYTIRGLTSRKSKKLGQQSKVFQEKFVAAPLTSSNHTFLDVYEPGIKILPISALVDRFTAAMKLDRRHFPILNNFNSDS